MLLIALSGSACADSGEDYAKQGAARLVGDAAPAMEFTTIDGAKIDLGQHYGRAAVYLKFWATSWPRSTGAPTRARSRRFDSTLTRPRSSALADACWLILRLEEDPVREPEFRVPYIAAGWLPIYEFDADGPDGRSRVFQLDPVRCLVEVRWDGGDDGDSTSVPAPWFEQHIACYRR